MSLKSWMHSHGGQLGEFRELSGAVAELFRGDTHFIEQRDVQVRQRRAIGIHQVTAALDRPRASTKDRRTGALGTRGEHLAKPLEYGLVDLVCQRKRQVARAASTAIRLAQPSR